MKQLSKAQRKVLFYLAKDGYRLFWDYDQVRPRLIDGRDGSEGIKGRTLVILVDLGLVEWKRDTDIGRAYKLSAKGAELASTITEADFT